jgi:hypothetical protein
MSQQIKHTEGSSIETFQLNNSIANGIYQLEINKPDRSVMITNVSLLK